MSSTEINLDTQNNLSLVDTSVIKSTIQSHFDNMSLFSTNDVTKKYLIDMLYLLSHIVFASILVVCLKNTNTTLLTIILSIILGYISYDEQHNIPVYTLFSVGCLMYFFDLFIMSKSSEEFGRVSLLRTLKTTIWKLPYYGILSYYVILYIFTHCFKFQNISN